MPSPASALQALREFILARRAAAATAPEQKMLQGVYRGYAGENATPVVEYHGGTYVPGEPLTRPLYTTRDPEFAARYAEDKGGSVVKLAPQPRNVATPSELREMATRYLPENEARGYTPASALDTELHGERAVQRLLYELERPPFFYDAVRAADIAPGGTAVREALVMLPGRRTGVPAAPTEDVYVTPQRRVAEYYAEKRAAQTGRPPHVEMLLVDPFAGKRYGHSVMGSGARLPMDTVARRLKPEDIKERTQLKARGGLAQAKERSYHG